MTPFTFPAPMTVGRSGHAAVAVGLPPSAYALGARRAAQSWFFKVPVIGEQVYVRSSGEELYIDEHIPQSSVDQL